MFSSDDKPSGKASLLEVFELVYHVAVQSVRKSHRNALVGLGMEILQSIIFVAVFYAMFTLLGMRGSAIRGDFIMYLMSGIFLFMTHTKAMAAVMTAEPPTSPIMNHARMNVFISILANALKSLYLQILAMGVILLACHLALNPIVVDNPGKAALMFFAAWFSGFCIGLVFAAAKPWSPEIITILQQLVMRVNMIASGKMFVANSLPGSMLPYFDWNPLFHAIDQMRGAIFINYYPRVTDPTYPFLFAVVLLMIGLMGLQYTRKYASASWSAGR